MTETDRPRALCTDCQVRQLVVDGVLMPHGRMREDGSNVERCPGSATTVPQSAVG